MRLGRPRRRTQRAASAISASAARGCPLLLCGSDSQRPGTHRTHPAGGVEASLSLPLGNPGSRAAEAAEFAGVDAHYEPIAGKTEACKPVQKVTQCASARYGTLRAVLGSDLAAVTCPGFFRRPPLVYSPTPSAGRPRHPGFVGHFLFSAKFICMGKQKNRLTAIQARRPRTRVEPVAGSGARSFQPYTSAQRPAPGWPARPGRGWVQGSRVPAYPGPTLH